MFPQKNPHHKGADNFIDEFYSSSFLPERVKNPAAIAVNRTASGIATPEAPVLGELAVDFLVVVVVLAAVLTLAVVVLIVVAAVVVVVVVVVVSVVVVVVVV
ncbi:MAG: hypothetical protein LUG26_05105 [Ruminococcus sp.]|nr:hypothetical protein [Ruminococcus sp.]